MESYEDAVARVVNQAPPLSDSQRARLRLLLSDSDPRARLAAAANVRPDLPVGISEEVSTDET